MKTYFPQLFILFSLLLSACTRKNLPLQAADTTGFLPPGNHNMEMTVDNLPRTYILHVPPAAETGDLLPLIIVLHGSYGTGLKMQIGLGFDPYADSRGFYTAYPDAYIAPGERETARWNDGRGTLESSTQDIDDVKFITTLVDEISSKVSLDRSRVFVTGASNGGMMTYRLGCETDGVFAGIAPVIGNIPEPTFGSCSPQAALNFLAINGDSDPFIPIEGGEVCEEVRVGCEGGWVASMAESVGKFASANGCPVSAQSAALPIVVDDGTSIEQLTYSNCTSGAQVLAYVVHQGGHTWPPRESQLAAGGQSTGNLDATQVIVDFFLSSQK